MTTENTAVTAPASSAETQPSTEVAQETPRDAEGTGASEKTAEEQQREASEAGKRLAEQRERNKRNAFMRVQQRNEALERQNEELVRAVIARGAAQSAPAQPHPTADAPPNRDTWTGTYEEFLREEAKYYARKESEDLLAKREAAWRQQAEQEARAQQMAHVVAGHASRVQEFAKANPDFQAVFERNDVEVPLEAAQEILDMPDGPQIMLAMHQEPAIAEYMATLSPRGQIRYLGQLSAALRLRPPQISKAPPPGKTVGSGSAGDTKTPSDSDSIEEWTRKRNAQLRARR